MLIGICNPDANKKRMKIIYYIKRFWQIPTIEKIPLAKGILLCLIFVPIVQLLPLKNYIWILKTKPKSPTIVKDNKYFIWLTRRTMKRIEQFNAFKFSCLVKSIVFKMLLNSFGINNNIALGVNNSYPSLLKVHAFVKVDNKVVYLRRKEFIEIYSF